MTLAQTFTRWGVTLYKLLTGSTPIQADTVSSQSLVEVLEIIREKDPPRPSQRLQLDFNSAATIGYQRRCKPERLQQALKGDVDWIVMKALEKDRNRRYETSNGLARDIERYLCDDEVSARPPTNLYRIQKFVRRNRGLVASLVTFAVLLMAGLIGTGAGLYVAITERDRANDESRFAAKAARDARIAQRAAQNSEAERRQLQHVAEDQLYAVKMKSAFSDWQLSNVESAWKMLLSANSRSDGWEARFLRGQFTASKETVYAHAIHVTDVELSPDGHYLATAGADHRVHLWDATTRELVFTQSLTGAVTRVRFSSDSSMMAAADLGNRVTIWETSTGRVIREFGPFERDVFSVEFLDNEILIAGEHDKNRFRRGVTWQADNRGAPDIVLLSITDGSELERLSGHEKTINEIRATDDGKTILSCSDDGTVRVLRKNDSGRWDATVVNGHTSEVKGLAVSPCGTEFATCGLDQNVFLWNLESGVLVRTFVGHTDAVSDVAFSPNGRKLVTSSYDFTARVWDRNGRENFVCRGHFGSVNGAVFSADGSEFFTVSDDQTIRVWDVDSLSGILAVKPHTNVVWQADLSADSRRVVSCSEDGTVARIDTTTGKVESVIDNGSCVLSIAHSPASDVFATGDADSTLRIWDSISGAVIKTILAHDGYIWDVAYSGNGRLLATSSADRTVKIWDTQNWSHKGTLIGHTGEMSSARFSSDGRYIVTSSDDETVRLWDAVSLKCLHTFKGHSHSIWRATFSPDSKLIASSGFNGEIIIWSVAERKLIRKINTHSNQVAGLSFTADGSRIVSASDDGTAIIHDVSTGIDLFVMRDYDDTAIVHASFSRDGQSLVTGNGTGWVTIRSARTIDTGESVFLPEHAVRICMEGLTVVISEDSSIASLEHELKLATKCCSTFCSYRSWTVKGVAEYRLGRLKEAIDSLREAQHLEPIQYGEPDERPDIEAFLSMAYVRTGQLELASATKTVFDSKSQLEIWSYDPVLQNIADEVQRTFDAQNRNVSH